MIAAALNSAGKSILKAAIAIGICGITLIIGAYALGRYHHVPELGLPVTAPVSQRDAANQAHLYALQFGRGAWVGSWNTDSRSMSIPISGNMIPVVMPVPPERVQIGALAVFMDDTGRFLCHQVAAVREDGFLPSGTANKTADGWQPWSRFHGVVIGVNLHE